MKVLLLLAFATVGQCALLGSKKCTYGPSYWCSHLHHAKECSAVQHCMTTVWKNQKVGTTGSNETCLDYVKILDIVRVSSDDSLLEQMAVGCTGMSGEKRALCKDLMSHDTKEVYVLLKSDLSSDQIAAALGLCGEFADTVEHHEQASGDYCQDCVNFVTDIRGLLNNLDKPAEALVKEEVCSKMGALEGMCDQMADQYVPLIMTYITQQLDPKQLCLDMRMCASQMNFDLMKSLKAMMTKPQESGLTCDLCKTLANELQKAIRNTDFQNGLLNYLENHVCTILPADLTAQCKSYVTDYGRLVFEVIISELDPNTICQTIGLCSGKERESMQTQVLLGSLRAVQMLASVKKNTKREGSSVVCELCQDLSKTMQEALSNTTFQTGLLTFMENKVCTLLTGTWSSECKTYVTEYGSFALSYLAAELDPKTICHTLGFCNATRTDKSSKLTHVLLTSARLGSMQNLSPDNEQKNVKGSECVMCELILKALKKLIGSKSTEAEIKTALEDICNRLPASLSKECDALVDNYSTFIIDYLLNDLSPTQACTKMDFCSSALVQKVKSLMPVKPLTGTETCLICETAVGYIKGALHDPQAIVNIAEKVCSFLPAVDVDECSDLIDKYLPAILNLMYQEMDPKQICTGLGLCKSHSLKFQPLMDLMPAKPMHLGSDKCLYGPSFWCASVQNAKLCNATKNCVDQYGMKLDD